MGERLLGLVRYQVSGRSTPAWTSLYHARDVSMRLVVVTARGFGAVGKGKLSPWTPLCPYIHA